MLIAKAIHFYHCGRAVFQRVLPIPRVLLGLGLVCLLSCVCLTPVLFTPQNLQKQVGELESQASLCSSGLLLLSLHAFLMV